jgi:hypothetical protein
MTRAIYDDGYHSYQELTYIFGPRLVLTPGYEAAMHLVQWYNSNPPLEPPGIEWSKATGVPATLSRGGASG